MISIKNETQTLSGIITSIGTLTTLCTLIIISILYYNDVCKSMDLQLLNEVKNECLEARDNFKTQIEAKFDWLKIVAGITSFDKKISQDEEDRLWQLIHDFDKENAFYIGIIDEKGILHQHKNEQFDISQTETFKRVTSGLTSISPITNRIQDGKKVIIISTPIYNYKNEIVGGIEVEYSTIELGRILNLSEPKFNGYNLVIDSAGHLIASHPNMEIYETIFEMLETRNFKDNTKLQKMVDSVKENKSGSIKYSFNGDTRILCWENANINDWSIVSIKSVDNYAKTLMYVKKITKTFMGIAFILVIIGTCLFIQTVLIKKLELKSANIDHITGLYTRRQGIKLLKYKFNKSNTDCFGCIFVDLDHFKQINDSFGHTTGDDYLRAVGKAISSSVKNQDIAYRFGGDEFCIWLFGKGSKETLLKTAEDISKKSAAKNNHINLSIGITQIAKDEKNLDEILKRVDKALYEAKTNGRNQIIYN